MLEDESSRKTNTARASNAKTKKRHCEYVVPVHKSPTLELQELISPKLIIRRIITRGKLTSSPIPPHNSADVNGEAAYKGESVEEVDNAQCNVDWALEKHWNHQDATDDVQNRSPEHPDEPRDKFGVDWIGVLTRLFRA